MTADNRRQLRLGATKTAALALGCAPFGLAYGILSTSAGLTVTETMMMSLLVFAGAAQLTAVVMLQGGAGIALVIISTFLINLRHLVMGLSISPYFTQATPAWRRVLAFAMTDEAYLVSIGHFREEEVSPGDPYFMLGSGGLIYVVWNICSAIGAVAGQAIDDPLKWGLDFAMPAAFLTLLLPQVSTRRSAAVVAVAAAVALATYVLIPGKWYIILAVLAGTIAGVLLETAHEARAETKAAS